MTRHVGFHESVAMTPVAPLLRIPSNAPSLDEVDVGRLWLDRGETRIRLGSDGRAQPRLVAVTRSASLGIAARQVSFWLVLRGTARVACREGRFQLETGAWLALDHESQPTITVDPRALVVAVLLPSAGPMALQRDGWPPLLPGRGRIGLRDRRLAFAHCRRAGLFASVSCADIDVAALRHMTYFLSTLQSGLAPLLERCPGRALWRRRLVLARLQSASLYVDGNLHRGVPLAELAGLIHFSTWYFHKTFHAVYGEGPREMASRLRLQMAADLVANTGLSIGEVGLRCGFQNACSFARAFRSRYGVSASTYRLSQRDVPKREPATPRSVRPGGPSVRATPHPTRPHTT
jgi:AraC family transcriptional regulator